jgi:peptide/nickel transport system ATP-binding protein
MAPPDDGGALLRVQGLRVQFATAAGWLTVVDDVGFSIRARETVGLVGESGSGKTVSSLAVMGLLPPRNSRVADGTISFAGRVLNRLPAEEMRDIRGNEISMIFQEPMTSLNPAFTVGNQIAEAMRLHLALPRRVAWGRTVEMLDVVGIPDPHRRARDYPHALSGGMRQRAMIAMALACQPKLLIADEPTTALDVTIQAQVLELIRSLQATLGMAVLFVTHDLAVVAEICDRVVVMYAGQVVEQAPVGELFARPRHPYTQALLASMPQVAAVGGRLTVIPGQVPRPDQLPGGCRFHPRCAFALPACGASPVGLTTLDHGTGATVRCLRQAELELAGVPPTAPARPAPGPAPPRAAILELRGLTKEFSVPSGVLRRVIGRVQAVSGVDLRVGTGETVGLVGESGSGKSTLARLALRLIEPTSGRIVLDGTDITSLPQRRLRTARRDMQIVFQDPYSSLDPRATIGEAVAEPLEVHDGLRGRELDARVAGLLEQVGLNGDMARRYPHEFSGGQRQRIAVARALALNPRLLICDEPVSSLDVSTQSQVINLLTDLQDELGLSYLFIAHDLSVVRHISDRIAVMYLGRIVEEGPAEEVYTRPRHPYTLALLSAIPVPDPSPERRRRRIVLQGDVPSPLDPPAGCRFHPRCPFAMDICAQVEPEPFTTTAGTVVACHLHTSGPGLGGQPVTVDGIPARPAATGQNDARPVVPPRARSGPARTES